MKKSTSSLLAACALVLLPLTGCSAVTPDAADGTHGTAEPVSSATDGGTSPGGDTDSTEQLTQEITAANHEGTAEVTVMGPESWHAWGPGDIVRRGRILSTGTESEDHAMGLWVHDGWPYACTPENLATQECETRDVEYESYETLETITIDGYDAPGFEHVQDYDDYMMRTQSRLLDMDGVPLTVTIWTDDIDEDFPQVLVDIRDSLTVEFID